MGEIQGADIEIIDRNASDGQGVLVPSALRINGVEIAVPGDAVIRVSELRSDSLVTVTLTVFARSLTIRRD